jgi:hypothetical protein
MLNALEQPETSARLAVAARQTAAALFAPQRMLDQYRRAYAAVGAGVADQAYGATRLA